MSVNDILTLVICGIVGYSAYTDLTKEEKETIIVDNSEKIDSLTNAIISLNEKIDPMVNHRIDKILNKEYEGFEECIDTVWNNGVIEYHWNGCN